MITGIARIFQQGAKGGNGGGIFCTSTFLFSLSNQWGGGGSGPLYPLIATPVIVVLRGGGKLKEQSYRAGEGVGGGRVPLPR